MGFGNFMKTLLIIGSIYKLNNNSMEQKKKDLLLKDLCSRLPYGVKCSHKTEGIYSLTGIDLEKYNYIFIKHNGGLKISEPEIKNIKPYLFPISSMTEEQKKDMIKSSCGIGSDKNVFDWYNKNHFDYIRKYYLPHFYLIQNR